MQEYYFSILLAIIALQLITICVLLGSNKKQGGRVGSHHAIKRAGSSGGDGKGDKAPVSDARRGSAVSEVGRRPDRGSGRPQSGGRQQGGAQGQRGQGQAGQDRGQPAAIDPMEMSLRDINRKLKNAEREQENARKKIQDSGRDVIGRDADRDGGNRDGGNRDSFRDRPRIERADRSGSDRSDRGPRPERGVRRDFNRAGPRPERPDRPDRVDQPQRDFDAAAGFMQTSTVGADIPPPVNAVAAPPPPPPPPMAPAVPVSDVGIGNDADLQHGRKFTAKRRPLPSESAPSAPSASGEAPVAEPISAPPVVETVAQDNATEISYGR